MEKGTFEIESQQLFSKSKIWQLNRDFYQYEGVKAFSENIVPHHLTSNGFVGKTYAELIFAFLTDLGLQGHNNETVYILELGAGHGRLAYHILQHLKKLKEGTLLNIPSFCYVISDVIEENLSYFLEHPQLAKFFDDGSLDCSFFDAIQSKNLILRKHKKTIIANELNLPIIAIANYLFDSIPNSLFLIKDGKVSDCTVSIKSEENPKSLDAETLVQSLSLSFGTSDKEAPFFENNMFNEILEEYRQSLSDTYLFFPEQAMHCLQNIMNLSSSGLFLLTMDKGFHEIHDLENRKKPDFVTHGSFSFWVNYHALARFCKKLGGLALFPSFSTFHLEMGALMFLQNSESFQNTSTAYRRSVDDFGPDDFNTLKQMSYHHIRILNLKELIALFRLSNYDSTLFIKLLPRLKQVSSDITFNERKRIAETLNEVWRNYFSIGEQYDLANEIAGIYYDLGFYNEALIFFQNSMQLHVRKADTYYNIALSHYQLRQDKAFFKTIQEGKLAFPEFEAFNELEKLDLS